MTAPNSLFESYYPIEWVDSVHSSQLPLVFPLHDGVQLGAGAQAIRVGGAKLYRKAAVDSLKQIQALRTKPALPILDPLRPSGMYRSAPA